MKTKGLAPVHYLLFLVFLLPTGSFAQLQFKFQPREQEKGAFRFFEPKAEGISPINLFFLAKFSELMYLERMEYQLRYLENGYQPVDSIPDSEWIKQYAAVNDDNFQEAFQLRFAHYFDYPRQLTGMKEEQPPQTKSTFHFMRKMAYLGGKKDQGLDPELMIVNTPRAVVLVYRGTDKVEENEWSEWKGTDFRIQLVQAGGFLINTKVHKGFWQSFDLIRDELMRTLQQKEFKHKPIWITGHSLGGAMAIISGVYLKAAGLPVQNVYTFASPRTIGNKKFAEKLAQLLPNKVHRFEYYLDPVSILWAPGYTNCGQRHWFDAEDLGGYQLHENVRERYTPLSPFKFHKHPFRDKRTLGELRLKKEMENAWLPALPIRVWYHNPQFYVKAAYEQLTEEQKKVLPGVDDSFPYLYFGGKSGMPGSK